jgi:hypothetical protein
MSLDVGLMVSFLRVDLVCLGLVGAKGRFSVVDRFIPVETVEFEFVRIQ